jgi:hypothetical protein
MARGLTKSSYWETSFLNPVTDIYNPPIHLLKKPLPLLNPSKN